MNVIDRLPPSSATSPCTSSHAPIPVCTAPCPFAHFHLAAGFILAACSLILAACSTDKAAAPAPRPSAGLVEYQQLVKHSRDAVEASLMSLDKVTAQTQSPERAIAAFSDQIDHLAAESVQVRARSQAILARGDAYFENWTTNMAALKNPKVRAQAEAHRPELQQRFATIKTLGQDARAAFQTYLAGLRQLRTALESDPGALLLASNQTLARTTRQSGVDVEHHLDRMRDELADMALLLKPDGAGSSH